MGGISHPSREREKRERESKEKKKEREREILTEREKSRSSGSTVFSRGGFSSTGLARSIRFPAGGTGGALLTTPPPPGVRNTKLHRTYWQGKSLHHSHLKRDTDFQSPFLVEIPSHTPNFCLLQQIPKVNGGEDSTLIRAQVFFFFFAEPPRSPAAAGDVLAGDTAAVKGEGRLRPR